MDLGDEGKLCQTCVSVFQGHTAIHDAERWYRPKGQYSNFFNRTHHEKYCDLVASKDGGCFICSWLWAKHMRLSHPSEEEGEQLEGFRIFCRIDGYRGMGARDVHFCALYPWGIDFELHVSLAKDINQYANRPPPLPWSDLEVRQWSRLDLKLGSSEDLDIIRGWISSCEADHKHCAPNPHPAPRTFLPTRILDVKDAGTKLGMARLRNRDEVEQLEGRYPAYWTLSHRWGDPEKMLQLLQTTEHRFRKGISIQELPPTFRDAVLLVHRLGYRYIWIDSLCILQDSLADWQNQANAMVDVYRHSFCNISAAGPSYDPSNSGLFCERTLSRRLLYPFKVNVDILDNQQGEPMSGPWMACNESAWADEVESAPISSRGWVVQERFLSARVVHFTRNQIYWECLESNLSAADPTGKFSHRRSSAATNSTGYKTSRLGLAQTLAALTTTGQPYSDPNTARLAHSYHQQWGVIVSLYVGCALTRESDRFLAMSGIAKAFGEVNGDVYLAGVWQRMLHTDLLWSSRASVGVPARRSNTGTSSTGAAGPEPCYAPSWSWASVVGGSVRLGVSQNRYGSLPTPLVRLVEARVVPEPPDGDPTGLLRSAELDLECMLYYFRWRGRERVLRVFRDEARSDCWFEKKGGLGPDLDLWLDTSELVERFEAADESEGVCIPVNGTYSGYGGGVNVYLLLERDAGDRFRRIGILKAGEIGKWISDWSGDRSRITLV